MILKFKTGKGARGLLDYIATGSEQSVPMFTNMAGKTPRALAREVAALRSLRPNLGKAVGHLILSHDPSQRALTEEEWRQALDIALSEHGAQGAAYAAYMHTDKGHQHLHVCLLRIRGDGSVVSDSNSYRKNERAARAIETHFGLDAPKPRAPEDRHPRAHGARAERGRRRFERLHASIPTPAQPTPKGVPKVIDPHSIFSTVDEANDLDDLKERLARRGIEAKFVQAPGAQQPTGWLLRQAGAAGTWIKGSDVDRALSLKKVQERMQQRQGQAQAAPDLHGHDAARQQLRRSGGGLMGVLVGLSLDVGIHLVVGLVNLIARVLARRAKVPAETLGRIDMATDGTPILIDPVDLPPDSSADMRANLDAALTVMSKVMDQTAEAIQQEDTSLLPTVSDPEVQAERARVIAQLDERGEDDGQDTEYQYERERPR